MYSHRRKDRLVARPVHFEITASDPQRVINFYEQAFGWKFHKWEGPQTYWLITTGEPGQPGIDGGMSERAGASPASTTNTIGVASVDTAVQQIEQAGGKVVHPKMAIPGVGYFAHCQDPDGTSFGIMQSDP